EVGVGDVGKEGTGDARDRTGEQIGIRERSLGTEMLGRVEMAETATLFGPAGQVRRGRTRSVVIQELRDFFGLGLEDMLALLDAPALGQAFASHKQRAANQSEGPCECAPDVFIVERVTGSCLVEKFVELCTVVE